ncbi:hypothetical protein BMI79_07345 [Serratia oryzae]|uniref:Uncharacterized protein n=1 Tax=Serratia oryzae TaxID=2034155 RepID=A0A1S8CN26_9GAMM|nr:hypothetical protein BMI79_07345 [Serratia oryzae]VXC91667.1 conserved hypothetical protein [Enterobacterales bacterium 8AC]
MLIIYLNKWSIHYATFYGEQAEFCKHDNLTGMIIGFITAYSQTIVLISKAFSAHGGRGGFLD